MVRLLNSKKINRREGFSLVEVAMSLAIVGFACVAMLGLIPMGLTTFHKAMGNTIEADIVQNLTNDILLANFSSVYQYNNQTYYYDSEGSPLPSSGSVPAGTVYKALVTIKGVDSSGATSSSYAPVSLANGATGGVSSSTATSTSAYNVAITITNVSSPTQSDVFPIIVPNNNL